MNPQQALDLAAHEAFPNKGEKPNCVGHARTGFVTGALSPEAMRYWEMNSPAVQDLRDAIDGIETIALCTVIEPDKHSLLETILDRAKNALKAWDERER